MSSKAKTAKTLSDLTPNPKNPRQDWKPEAQAAFSKSLAEFGDLGGIVRNRRTGQIVGGHKRVEDFLRLENAQIIVSDRLKAPDKTGTIAFGYVHLHGTRYSFREVDWAAEKETAANLAANKHGAEWDEVKLAEMLKELGELKFPMELTGFNAREIEGLLQTGEVKDTEPQMDKAEELRKKWKTKVGQLWSLGQHRLLCGDSTDPKIISKVMDGQKATLIFTDPPYGVSIGKKNVMLNTFQKAGTCLANIEMDDMPPDELGKMLLAAFTTLREHMADDCAVFVCSPQGGGLGMMMMMMMMKAAGLEVRHILNWVKNSPTFSMGRLDYDYQHEPILFTWLKTHKRKKLGAFQTSLWPVDKPRSNKLHATTKPVELPTCAILNHTDENDIVVDNFLGSGTTLIACQNQNRRCFAVDKKPAYIAVALQRWSDHTGQTPKLL